MGDQGYWIGKTVRCKSGGEAEFSARGDDVSHSALSNGGPGGGGVNVTKKTLHNLVDLAELTSPMTLV